MSQGVRWENRYPFISPSAMRGVSDYAPRPSVGTAPGSTTLYIPYATPGDLKGADNMLGLINPNDYWYTGTEPGRLPGTATMLLGNDDASDTAKELAFDLVGAAATTLLFAFAFGLADKKGPAMKWAPGLAIGGAGFLGRTILRRL